MKKIEESEKMLSEPKPVSITGCLCPFKDEQPCFVEMPNNSQIWIAVFSTNNKLNRSCAELGIVDYVIKEITDGNDFLESIVKLDIRIMLDPYVVENKTRWTEVAFALM
jgi:hypothetical protein